MKNKIQLLKILIILMGIVTGIISVYAADKDDGSINIPAQATFFYPLGTNGIGAPRITNQFSLNMIYGNNGGVNGLEIGGIINIDHLSVHGVQIAGICNTVYGNTSGFQAAGITNICRGNTETVQMAGLANYVEGSSTGFQAAGIINITSQPSKTFQLAGLTNISTKGHEGVQIAGILNYARKQRGMQIAMINMSDSLENGIPIGLISYVNHGYHTFEIAANETLFMNLLYKTGVNQFYNIVGIGYRPGGDNQGWGLTYGIGTLKPLSQNSALNFDLTATHLNEGTEWTKNLNLLTTFKINFSMKLVKGIHIFAGPAVNLAFSKMKDEEGKLTGSALIPEKGFYQGDINHTRINGFLGLNAGIRF